LITILKDLEKRFLIFADLYAAEWSRGPDSYREPAKRPEAFGFALIFFATFLYQDKKGEEKKALTNDSIRNNCSLLFYCSFLLLFDAAG
jgi:hypothetical protein